MKIKEIVSRGRNLLKEHYGDSRLSARLIWNVTKTIAYQLIHREKNKIYNTSLFKYISIDSEEVNLLESSCVPLNCMGCRIKIPEALENDNGLVYSFLGSPDMSTSWTIVSPNNFMSKQNMRGGGKYAYRDQEYIYFNGDDCLPCYKLGYIPKEDEETLSLTDGDSCSILEQESSIPDHLLYAVFRMTPQEFSIYLQKPYNHTTNKNENN